ncbi:class I SAM-dependent methyltransferase [Devosia sp. SL43]|uniref:class I SAM-dependent methyltransferase n=1 Tax=Devosia sp. SL43 TaxID=2806348 RepID=UPI001F3550CB|nr:class I SAM-dependent methyltransferase [Devosia sp. SL43]UJW85670.1 class I SAM-dependent methyltransferase [Devosia sp. SL43]
MTDDRKTHWENVYQTKGDDQVSWTEGDPTLSLYLLKAAGLTPAHTVIDVGGGASRLVDRLVQQQQAHITVLDLSAAALARAQARLDGTANTDWIVADITAWQPPRQYDFWHDRAVFHFMTDATDRAAYLAALAAALPIGGIAVFGTFALDGPEKCSGLPVMRYDAAGLSAVLGDDFALLAGRRHDHTTPWGATQHFQFSTFRRL